MEKLIFRKAIKDDLPAIIGLLLDDQLGSTRESATDLTPYVQSFKLIDQDQNQMLMVASSDGEIVGTCHLTLMPSLTFKGSTRLNIEAVRIASSFRGAGLGAKMIKKAIEFGQEHGAAIIQIATNNERSKAKDFYQKLGFVASHVGMKLYLL